MAERTFTDLELERHLAGDLSAARASELEAKASAADRARLDELRAEQQAFLAQVDVDAEVRAIGRRMTKVELEPRGLASWWRWVAAGGALAAAAVAILVLTRRTDAPSPGDDDLGIKGGDVALIVHAERGQLATGDTVVPGDRLRFELNAGAPGYAAVIGVDGSGTPTVYFPDGAPTAAPVDPTATRILPGAIELDATPGDETFHVFYADRPFAVDLVLPAVRGGPLPVGVTSATVSLHKQTGAVDR